MKQQPTVIEINDHHDERYFLESVQDAAETGAAHVYERNGFYVISAKPLSDRQVNTALNREHKAIARDWLKDGVAPYDVWGSLYISAARVSRIAKEEGIELPKRWFSDGQREDAKWAQTMADFRGDETLA